MVGPVRGLPHGNKFKLGIFGANCSSGLAMTKVPERWPASWDGNEALAELADRAGIEFLLPIARWRGYGGATDFEGESWETITWATGLLACTERITVFGTVHAPLIHPIVAAKQLVTADLISGGRVGLNIVCGWNEDEFEMFGTAQRAHDTRYDYGAEWFEVVRRIWSEADPFDHEGAFLSLRAVIGKPKPWGGSRPVVMNAGGSDVGRAFGARHCDFVFTLLVDLELGRKQVAAIKAIAEQHHRTVDVFTTSYVVCRPTRKEAEEFHRYYVDENGDWEAVDRLMTLQGLHTRGRDFQRQFRERFAGGHGCYPIIGDPDDVAAELERISDAGFIGTTVAFVDYLQELPYFCEQVLPRLERVGLRDRSARKM